MAKYVRLKDGTICDDGNEYIIDEEGNYCEVRTFMGRSEEVIMIPKDNIEKESDNLEDLFDEIIICYLRNNKIILRTLYRNGETIKSALEHIKKVNLSYDSFEIYGAIWIDKGLIYVAKMNKNGELELI